MQPSHFYYEYDHTFVTSVRGGNLLAPHDLIWFQFLGQRFDSDRLSMDLDATIFCVHFHAWFKIIIIIIIIKSEFATQSLLITSYFCDDYLLCGWVDHATVWRIFDFQEIFSCGSRGEDNKWGHQTQSSGLQFSRSVLYPHPAIWSSNECLPLFVPLETFPSLLSSHR